MKKQINLLKRQNDFLLKQIKGLDIKLYEKLMGGIKN